MGSGERRAVGRKNCAHAIRDGSPGAISAKARTDFCSEVRSAENEDEKKNRFFSEFRRNPRIRKMNRTLLKFSRQFAEILQISAVIFCFFFLCDAGLNAT